MSTEQDDIDAALDNLESDEGVTLADLDGENDDKVIDGEVVVLPVDEGEPAPKAEDIQDDDPPGFKSYEQYIEDGGDPDTYRGKKAYSDQYNLIQDNREIKGQLNSLNETIKHVATANDTWRDQQMDSMRAELTHELEVAKEASDVDAALATQAKLDNLKPTPTTQPTPQESPIITKFRQDNPMTDQASSRFNADFNADVTGFYNAMVADLTGGGKAPMTEGQVTRCLNLAQKKAAELNPDLFESRRNNRQGAPLKAKKAAATNTTDLRARLKGVGNPRNKTDSNAGQDMYDMILETGGKEAADAFAKANTGE